MPELQLIVKKTDRSSMLDQKMMHVSLEDGMDLAACSLITRDCVVNPRHILRKLQLVLGGCQCCQQVVLFCLAVSMKV